MYYTLHAGRRAPSPDSYRDLLIRRQDHVRPTPEFKINRKSLPSNKHMLSLSATLKIDLVKIRGLRGVWKKLNNNCKNQTLLSIYICTISIVSM